MAVDGDLLVYHHKPWEKGLSGPTGPSGFPFGKLKCVLLVTEKPKK